MEYNKSKFFYDNIVKKDNIINKIKVWADENVVRVNQFDYQESDFISYKKLIKFLDSIK